MPWSPKRPCQEPGCALYAEIRGRCPAHAARRQATESAARRADPVRAFYLTGAWRRFRASVLRARPICEYCGAAPSTEVDHVVTIRVNPDLALSDDNVRAACRPCHTRRTIAFQGWHRRRS